MAGQQSEAFGPTLDRLSTFVRDLDYGDIPMEVREMEKRHVLDTLGCILYGSTTPWVGKVARTLDRVGERGTASVLGTAQSVPPARAALINGTASHSMDFDDHCQEAGIHAGSATVPTALAAAEAADDPVDGREFLTSVTAGVEIGIRSGFGVGYGSVGRGWHIAGWTGAFAGAATTGKLFDLDHGRQCHALAVAGTQGCGLLGAQYGAEVKRFHMGKAAEAGYLGAALARESFTGDTEIFQERYGAIGSTMSDDYDIDAVVDGLGERYRILDKLVLKPFPSVGQVHAAVDATRAIIACEGIDPSEVSSVRVRVTPTVKDHVGWEYEPTDVMSAQANIQYAIATLLVEGRVTVDAYAPAAIGRNAVLSRVEDVVVVDDDGLDDETFGSVVELTTGGETHSHAVYTPRGYPTNPLSDAEIKAKFRDQAENAIPTDSVDRIVALVHDLERVEDVGEIVRLCRAGDGTR